MPSVVSDWGVSADAARGRIKPWHCAIGGGGSGLVVGGAVRVQLEPPHCRWGPVWVVRWGEGCALGDARASSVRSSLGRASSQDVGPRDPVGACVDGPGPSRPPFGVGCASGWGVVGVGGGVAWARRRRCGSCLRRWPAPSSPWRVLVVCPSGQWGMEAGLGDGSAPGGFGWQSGSASLWRLWVGVGACGGVVCGVVWVWVAILI